VTVPAQVRSWFGRWVDGGRPAQPAITWQSRRWIESYPDQADRFRALPDMLDRPAVRELALGYPRDTEGAFSGLVAALAWGWSTTPAGLWIARPILQAGAEVVGPRLVRIRDQLDAGGPLAGYRALMGDAKVPGLGQAFGTKLLYFLSSAEDRALIADSIIAKAFARANLARMPPSQCSPTRYGRYLADMEGWAAELSGDAVDGGDPIVGEQLEMILFGFNAPLGSAWGFANDVGRDRRCQRPPRAPRGQEDERHDD
jgi:hypothetical protein